MRLGDAIGWIFGTLLLVVGLILLRWSIIDGTYQTWRTDDDGNEGRGPTALDPATRVAITGLAVALAAPVTILAADAWRRWQADLEQSPTHL